jgi:hypothetical protein
MLQKIKEKFKRLTNINQFDNKWDDKITNISYFSVEFIIILKFFFESQTSVNEVTLIQRKK